MSRLLWVVVGLLICMPALAQDMPTLTGAIGELSAETAPSGASESVRLVILLTGITLLPGILLAMTPFPRIIIVFSLLRQALGLQQTPPNQILVGLALVVSMMIMREPLGVIYSDAVQPYMEGQITTEQAAEIGIEPLREFMLANVRGEELATAMALGGVTRDDLITEDSDGAPDFDELPTLVLTTGYILSELKAAFVIAVQVYLPFLVVDIIVASVLLGMGMMMLPPVVISLPFKLLTFVLMNGWELLITGLAGSFQ